MSQDLPSSVIQSSPLENYLQTNLRKLMTLLGVLLAALVAYGLASHSRQVTLEEAGAKFVAAKTVEDLDVVIAQHKGSLAAANALLRKAELLWEQNKKSTSADALREFTKNYPEHPLLAESLIALGSKLESLGQRDEAKANFERVSREFPKSELAALADLRLGDLALAQGNEEEARKIFEAMPAKHAGQSSQNAFLTQAESRLEWIGAKLPTTEVEGPAKPKEPAKPATTAIGPSKPLSPMITPASAPGSPSLKVVPQPSAPATKPASAPASAPGSAPAAGTKPAPSPAPAGKP